MATANYQVFEMSANEEEVKLKKVEKNEEDESILREMCTVNGINYDKLSQGSGIKVKCLEIFFFGCSKVVDLHHFSSLSCLRIVNQKISRMSGIGTCSSLKELWICEGNIENIEDLEGCPHLIKLYLYSNKIQSMIGINHLEKLEVLWLNNNQLKKIESLQFLTNLADINLAGNQIGSIKSSFMSLCKLKNLNLSGNPISSLEELTNLYCLSTLRSLSLCDPLYSSCPVCRLCNYSSIVLFHMPWLDWFDGKNVDSKDLQDLINNLVLKKKQFYRLKVHSMQQMTKKELSKFCQQYEQTRQLTYSRLRALNEHLKALEDSKCTQSTEKLIKVSAIMSRQEKLLGDLLHSKEGTELEKEKLKERERIIIEQWMTELQSAGNIRYVLGQDSMNWYKSCVELVSSRFITSGLLTSHFVKSFNIEKIVRIENNLLNNQFMDRLCAQLEDKEPKPSYRDFLDYLFLVWTPNTDFVAIGNKGCGPITAEKPYIMLTNSVNIAERGRLSQNAQLVNGELLLCKVYVGDMIEHKGGKIVANEDSCCMYQNLTSSSKIHPQREYYMFDSHLVLPEYMIYIKYEKYETSNSKNQSDSDNDIINMSPQPEIRPKLAMLDANSLLSITEQESLENIKELDLSCNRLTRFRFSSSLSYISSLSLSCNELSTAEDFSNMPHLQILNLSFNHLTTLEGIKSLPKLVILDVSWNQLTLLHQDIGLLKKQTPSLQSLDIRHNPWKKQIDIDLYVLGTLRSIKNLNGRTISEQDSTNALRQFVTSHLSLSSLLPHCRTDLTPLPSLLVSPLAKQIVSNSKQRPCQLNSSSDWTSQVTAVDLSGLQIQKLLCLDQLTQLKWVCLQDNALTSTEGLEFCNKLEELTLDNNFLNHSPPLNHFPHLRWLSLANNSLASLPLSTSPLLHLTYLNISGNNIKTISGIESLTALQELYASHNYIESLRQLFILKLLLHLVVIDFTFNPISSNPMYRLFVIFHLPSLKAIDSQPTDTNEIALAKEKLGGRLSQDIVYERYPEQDFAKLKKLDFTQCGLKHVDLSPVSSFDNLVSLNLEHNSLTTFSGLIHLNKLKVLCLNHNRIDALIRQTGGASLIDNSTPVLHNLQVLHLAYNGISVLPLLQLHRLPSLRALFLQGNEISRIEGLEGLNKLTELVLDRNKIKSLQEHSFMQVMQLRELHLEENRLCDLSHFYPLKYLERLYIGMNRIQDYSELEKLGCLPHLIELSIISNPVSRRMQHRSLLIYKLPSLQSLDGVLVTPDERHTAEVTFNDCRQEEPNDTPVPLLPALNNSGQVKIMSVPFYMTHDSPKRTQMSETRSLHLQTLQAFQDRRKGRK